MFEKITNLYPDLTIADFYPVTGTIQIVSLNGVEVIAQWNHPTYPEPTEEELAGV
jgi:hypothetical protein